MVQNSRQQRRKNFAFFCCFVALMVFSLFLLWSSSVGTVDLELPKHPILRSSTPSTEPPPITAKNYKISYSFDADKRVLQGARKVSSSLDNSDAPTCSGNWFLDSYYNDGNTMYYILEWVLGTTSTPSFNLLKKGPHSFIENQCRYQNCFITDNRCYLPNITQFNAILFNAGDVNYLYKIPLPQFRDPDQKYVFVSTEPASLNYIGDNIFDDYFNWTWTYRLDSDITWKYLTIYDMDGIIVGPKVEMKWPDKMLEVNQTDRTKLSGKNKTVAWFLFDCSRHTRRIAHFIQSGLAKNDVKLDTYGECGEYCCGTSDNATACYEMLQDYYYFYIVHEDYFDQDFVTEKLLVPLHNYAVPILYGGADYSRFLPPGSYLDGRALGFRNLSKYINSIINDTSAYIDFFRWRNHYQYAMTLDSEEVCNICAALNYGKNNNNYYYNKDMRQWWNNPKQTAAFKAVIQLSSMDLQANTI